MHIGKVDPSHQEVTTLGSLVSANQTEGPASRTVNHRSALSYHSTACLAGWTERVTAVLTNGVSFSEA